jgi:hypothetical protein
MESVNKTDEQCSANCLNSETVNQTPQNAQFPASDYTTQAYNPTTDLHHTHNGTQESYSLHNRRTKSYNWKDCD